jgi:uncharacterized protein
LRVAVSQRDEESVHDASRFEKHEILPFPGTELTALLFGGTFNCVKVTFDPAKRQAALDERGLDLADAEIVFAGLTLTVQDTRKDYGEVRFQTVGRLTGRMVMVVWTPRGQGRHIISMRKCNGREQAIYQKRFDEV